MKKIAAIVSIIIFFMAACNSADKAPDVSDLKIEITTERFEKDFFKLDTLNMLAGVQQLQTKYPDFFNDFTEKVLGAEGNGNAGGAVMAFLYSYRSLYDSSQLLFANFSKYETEIKKGLQLVKYYFPEYKLPSKIVTFIGPLDASYKTSFGLQGDILTNNAIGIGLQLHMGGNFSFYKSEQGMQLYPTYISANFEPAAIPVNAMRNIVDDIFPEDVKDVGSPAFYKSGQPSVSNKMLHIQLSQTNSTAIDETIFRTKAGASSNFDPAFDAYKLYSFDPTVSLVGRTADGFPRTIVETCRDVGHRCSADLAGSGQRL